MIHLKHNIRGNLCDLLSHGLYLGWQTLPPNPLLPLITSIIYQEQTQIGWKQIYYGRFAAKWVSTIVTHPQVNGTIFYLQILTEIWHAISMQWTIQPEQAPSPSKPPGGWQNTATQYGIANPSWCTCWSLLQDFLTSFEPEVLLQWPNKYIWQWIKNEY